MAYYVRTVFAGAGDYDPRARKYAIYHCDICDKNSDFTMTANFQTIERKCSHCGAIGVNDRIITLKKDREDILKKIADINTKLMDTETEISELEAKKNVEEQVEQITK